MSKDIKFYIEDDMLYLREPMHAYENMYYNKPIISKEAFMECCMKWAAPDSVSVLKYARAEIINTANYYNAEIDTEVASGLYKAADILDKYLKGVEK